MKILAIFLTVAALAGCDWKVEQMLLRCEGLEYDGPASDGKPIKLDVIIRYETNKLVGDRGYVGIMGDKVRIVHYDDRFIKAYENHWQFTLGRTDRVFTFWRFKSAGEGDKIYNYSGKCAKIEREF